MMHLYLMHERRLNLFYAAHVPIFKYINSYTIVLGLMQFDNKFQLV